MLFLNNPSLCHCIREFYWLFISVPDWLHVTPYLQNRPWSHINSAKDSPLTRYRVEGAGGNIKCDVLSSTLQDLFLQGWGTPAAAWIVELAQGSWWQQLPSGWHELAEWHHWRPTGQSIGVQVSFSWETRKRSVTFVISLQPEEKEEQTTGWFLSELLPEQRKRQKKTEERINLAPKNS